MGDSTEFIIIITTIIIIIFLNSFETRNTRAVRYQLSIMHAGNRYNSAV